MLKDPDWETRLLLLLRGTAEERLELAKKMSSDADPVVRQYAMASGRMLAMAATQPSAAPEAAPSAP
jgi:hypothetical protein